MAKRKKSLVKRIFSLHGFVFLLLLIPSLSLLYIFFQDKIVIQKNIPKEIEKPFALPETGAFIGVSLYDQNYRNLITLEKTVHKHFAIVGAYQAWGEKNNKFNMEWANNLAMHQALPLIMWEPWVPVAGYDRSENTVNQKAYRLKNIANGDFDQYVTQFAQDVKRFHQPVVIRFAHEMNGNWYPWGSTFNTPDEYIAAWRHIHEIFTKTGATNVIWLWSPNEIYQDARIPYADKLLAFYPGDQYVDWVGFSSFNWAGKYKQNIWRDPETLFTDTAYQLSALKKPIIIAETASAETVNPSQKAQWIKNLALYIKSNPKVKGVIWFNTEDNGINWKIESSQQSQDAFSSSFDSYFIERFQ